MTERMTRFEQEIITNVKQHSRNDTYRLLTEMYAVLPPGSLRAKIYNKLERFIDNA